MKERIEVNFENLAGCGNVEELELHLKVIVSGYCIRFNVYAIRSDNGTEKLLGVTTWWTAHNWEDHPEKTRVINALEKVKDSDEKNIVGVASSHNWEFVDGKWSLWFETYLDDCHPACQEGLMLNSVKLPLSNYI